MEKLIYLDNSVSIRSITNEDTTNIVRWRNSVKQYFINQEDITAESHIKWMKTMVLTGKVDQFIIENANGIGIGSVFLKDINDDTAEFGIFIGETDYLGKGYAEKAVSLVLAHAFDKLNLKKVFLRVLADNIRAIKLYEKVGFIKDETHIEKTFINGEIKYVLFMNIYKS